jgi:hypothetical protein
MPSSWISWPSFKDCIDHSNSSQCPELGFVAHEMKVVLRTLPNGFRTHFNVKFLAEQLWLHIADI